MPKKSKVALVTGATRGIGYNVGREIVKRMPTTTTYMTSRVKVSGFAAILGMELGAAARERAKFVKMDVREFDEIETVKKNILKNFEGIDILVNNAAVYHTPDPCPKAFPKQVQDVLDTNYWGTKNVISAFFPYFKPHSRIVNITSNLGDFASVKGIDADRKKALKYRFENCNSECELDGMMMKFRRDAQQGIWKKEGWPTCGYSVSKMAIDAYTRILQKQFDDDDRTDVVVNAVYPCTVHSKMDQASMHILDVEEGGRFVFYMATVRPNSHGIFPRGSIIWNNSKVVDNQEKYNLAKKKQSRAVVMEDNCTIISR